MLRLGDKLEELKEFLASQSIVEAAWVFGSYGTDTQNEDSDIDIAVLFGGETRLAEELQLESDICEVLRTDQVDVVILNNATIFLKHSVFVSGKLLYERAADTESDFFENVMKYYPDAAIYRRKFDAEYFAA